ncbi:unnamed protein product [Didymodactylos carnosus]|uniref:Uncharacterized protein n=1 Tax=Didymodactylos carnosus TaxID=1234261 RepID=A0A815LCH2_9BILA|nr:unnamed protein product [Didymodactylos carnosus]CAF1407415.1 unnamed protein product [Didymodactylos carnosus]CAF4079955.1 unnamed protein product [Didymodactylos carnosus]CAF4298032.1 unnamed protein product [Didymodactylos carnosus]
MPLSNFGPPKHVHSATIKNTTDTPVQCTIWYCGENAHHEAERINVTIPAQNEFYAETRAYANAHMITDKVIHKIIVTKSDGKKLELQRPFEGVAGTMKDGVVGAMKGWEFYIEENGIKSHNPYS